VEPTGNDPATSWMQTRESTDVSADSKALTPTSFPVCTSVCTSEGENANAGTADADKGEGEGIDQGGADRGSSDVDQGDPLAALAAAVANLSPADRERLAAMLTGHQGEGREGRA
jgi:hypothetical protein